MTNVLTPAPAPASARAVNAAAPNLSSFIWSVADLLRGDFKQSDYGKVILPFTVLRRIDCVLDATKPAVLAELDKRTKAGLNPEPFLRKAAGQSFYNTSKLDLRTLLGDQDHIAENLRSYLQAFAPEVRDIFERFDFHTQVERLDKANLLYLVTEKFATIDLHPFVVSNAQMGTVFEELIRRFAELSNETAGVRGNLRDPGPTRLAPCGNRAQDMGGPNGAAGRRDGAPGNDGRRDHKPRGALRRDHCCRPLDFFRRENAA